MSISIKTAREIEKMRRAGELLEKVHDELGRAIHPGMSTWEINKLGEEMIRSFGCTPNFLNYNGYPASICVSVNEEVVHGIPSKKRILKEGDTIPGENAMAAYWNVSRSTIRLAVRKLEDDGLI